MGDTRPSYLLFLVARKTCSLYEKFENAEKAQRQKAPSHLAARITDAETRTGQGFSHPCYHRCLRTLQRARELRAGAGVGPPGLDPATTASRPARALWGLCRPPLLCA